MYTITETINVTIGEYIPWLKLSTLQKVSIYHYWNCQRYNMWVFTMTETVNVTLGEYIPWLKLSMLQ
jgi:hypothetical protein